MTRYARQANSGTGPGEITPDGCAVEMYARLPDLGETAVIADAVPAGATLLELGSGAGRMTRPLAERGFRVTAVDESAAMLAWIDCAETVCCGIEQLDLGRRFDAVTLASILVNTADETARDGLLAACARHVAPGGQVLIQRQADGHHERRKPGDTVEKGGMTVTVAAMERVEDRVWRTRVDYAYEDATWSQTYYSRELPEPEFESALRHAGLVVDAYLTGDRTWVRAVPAR
ncbi:class I SAM-dependent methyltransferase [Streptomyces boncukensis]|uniref:Class I SAM-dependent methyltransferase n=1 Tax=Streptomyces boncukensis TaxID=2711219 RepID=A0A6G4X598_9ACTN|nr:class I SAM-dependent methyltransferase [Streptomyces boncukensis]NGO71841.1 class I SAM-dependent methyltransferase [Streptomyces boncukensis]